jgi:phosphopantetheinyl transferase
MSAYRSEARKRERLAVYALLYAMTGDEAMVIRHNEDGKPMVDGFHISVSHTRGYAALILSEHAEVAVDIEWRSDRVEKVVHKFVREDEDKSSLDMLLVNWSAKETVYKFFSEQDLQYFDMRLQPFDISPAGQIVVENLKGRQAADVHYRLTEDYVLTYTY